MIITLTKPGNFRVLATVILDDARVQELMEQTIRELGKNVRVKGFRPGMAPVAILREQLAEEDIHQGVLRKELPSIVEKITTEHNLRPIARPRVTLKAVKPMTLELLFLEEPTVTVKAKKLLAAAKKERESGEKKSESKEKEKKGEKDTDPQHAEAMKRREEEGKLFKLIADYTEVELAPELIEDEAEAMLEEQARMLKNYGIKFQDWLTQQKKTLQELLTEMRPRGEERLKIRFGVTALLKEWNVEVTDEEMKKAIDVLLQSMENVMPKTEEGGLRKLYEPGERLYEQFKRQKIVEKLLERLRNP